MNKSFEYEIYIQSKKFLLELLEHQELGQRTPEDILKQHTLNSNANLPDDISLIFQGLVASLSNAQSLPNLVINSIEGGFERYAEVLFGFNAKKVLQNYQSWEDLFEEIRSTLKPTGKLRTKPRSLWPRYCKSILSASKFINQFADSNDFYEWANSLYKDKRSKAALPLILEKEITGLGYALASDFLKELGFKQYGKPDVHTIDILYSISFIPKADAYLASKAIDRIAETNLVDSYEVDKILWLIGSGNFYRIDDLRTGNKKKEFISTFKYGGF